ncbi:MAG: VanZ family protein [Ignavibacteriales bacterium]|nr:VanZ family protein [Ignavibacteriales bacterium]
MKHFFKYQFPPFLWIIIIFGLSSIQRIPVIKSPIQLDKVVHIGLFFVLCWLVRRALFYQDQIKLFKNYPGLMALLFTAFYGLADEFHQKFVPGRTSDIYDVVADTAGALLYLLIFWLFSRRKAAARQSE